MCVCVCVCVYVFVCIRVCILIEQYNVLLYVTTLRCL